MLDQTINNRYHIESLLGRGGMGAVYRATDLKENQPVAVKVLHLFIDSETDAALTRFYREFRVLSRLNHPNIVRAFEHGIYQDAPFITLELLEGRTLAEEVAQGPLPRERMLDIARQICEALIYLHDQTIVHRDLKPGNLMLLQNNGDVQVKLMDFGLIRQANVSRQLTQEGVALGTVAYMAPEQAQGIPVDFRADLYALGAILYEMTTGHPPFVHENPAMILMQQLTTTPPPPRQLNPNIDEPLETLILDLLAKEPAKRPASTNQVAARLAQLADDNSPAVTPQPKRIDRIPHVPLIGREAAMAQLSDLWHQAVAGQGQVVLLSGVAGVGKTRLLNELSVQVQLGNGRFLRGHCREHGALPFEPIPQILETLLRDLPRSVFESLPPELTQIFTHEFKSIEGPQPAGNSDPAQARARFFAGCWEVLRQSAQKQPLMLVVEDTQWVDVTTLELRSYLARQMAQAPIMFVATARPEEIDAQSPLMAAIDALNRDSHVHAITLDLLTSDQVADFLKAALQQANIPNWVIDSFYQATNGNPLFIEETLKALAAEGRVTDWLRQTSSHSTRIANMTLQLPQNVLALAERRLQLLSDEDRPILTAAAVIGPEFPFDLLQGVTKLDEDTLLDAIDRLLAGRLIQELPLRDGEDRYRFTQEALRQALLNNVSRRRRRSLHRRAGEEMMAHYNIDQPRYWPLLAHHFEQAGEQAKAFKYHLLSGDAAARMYANPEAIASYSHALEIFNNSGLTLDDAQMREQLTQLYLKRGRSFELNTQFQEALDNYIDMEKLARQRGNQPMALASLLAQATIQATPTTVLNMEQAQAVSEQALALARELGDRQAEAKALWNLMIVARNMKRAEQAIIYGEQSLAIARELDLKEQIAYTLNDISWAYSMVRRPEKVPQVMSEARALWRELENMPMLADNLFSSASASALRGDLAEALDLTTEAISISQPINNWWALANSHALQGIIYGEFAEYDRAIEQLEQAIDAAEQGNITYMRFSALADLGWTYGSLGDIGRGLELLEESLANMESMVPGWRAAPLAMSIRLYLLNEDIYSALALVEQHRDLLTIEKFESFEHIWIALAQAELALHQQDFEAAVTITHQLAEGLASVNMKAYLADGLLLKGKALLKQSNLAAARDALKEARSVAEPFGGRRILWPVLFTLSQVEAQQGNTTEAESLRQQARALLEDIIERVPAELRDSFLGLAQVREVLG